MFETLFTVGPEQLSQGSLVLAVDWIAYLGVALVLALFVLGLLIHGGITTRLPRRQWLWLWLARSAALALLAFLLLDPALIAQTQQPITGRLAVLLDDSLSMTIPNGADATRGGFVRDTFAPGSGVLARRLEQDYRTRYWSVGGGVTSLEPGQSLRFNASQSNIAAALARLARDGGNVSTVVLVSDGGLSDPGGLEPVLQRLRSAGIPVHTVAVGGETPMADIELSQVSLPDRVLRGDTVPAQVTLSHRGRGGETVALTIEENSVIVARRTVVLPENRDRISVTVPLTFGQVGPRRVAVRVDGPGEEAIRDNNHQRFVVPVSDRRLNVLHVEGEPRFEVKFLRRAVADDASIRLASLIRTAENKYYRLGITDADELSLGFPQTDHALFRFDALVLGSVDAQWLAPEQQARIRDFVARRGGALLLLGGADAFAQGGFAGSSLAELLPVELADNSGDYRTEVRVRPTDLGRDHPLLGFMDTGKAVTGWSQLPELTVVNPLRRAKPGAQVLLEADDGGGWPLIILAYQRYGRGSVATLAVRNTWRWQMHADLPLADQTHEILWRNLLRGLARDAPRRLELSTATTQAALGQAVTVTARVLDADYQARLDARPTLEITTPLGGVETRTLQPEPTAGTYGGEFIVRHTGRYDVSVTVADGDGPALEDRVYISVDSAGREYFQSDPNLHVLSRIARETGGRLFHPHEMDALPAALDASRATETVTRRHELWNAPVFLLALLGLTGFEWFYRRRHALA